MIEVKNITKTYGSGDTAFQALKGITFTIKDGEFVAIMGPSGSGKSTLMHIIGALDTPTSGEYFLDGKDVSTLSEDAVRSQIQELLNEDNAKLFPNGKGEDPWRSVKGSVVLERVFASYELKYRKRNEGRLLAELVTLKRQPALTEIWDRVRSIFPTFPERPA